MKSSGKALLGIVVVILLAAIGWQVYEHLQGKPAAMANRAAKPIPVEVSPVQQGAMELRRTFSGTLEAQGQFTVAPKVSGRIERLYVNLADTVQRGQLVAELDNAEYEQAVAQAEADLAVARANLSATQSALAIANLLHEHPQHRARRIAQSHGFLSKGVRIEAGPPKALARDPIREEAGACAVGREAAVARRQRAVYLSLRAIDGEASCREQNMVKPSRAGARTAYDEYGPGR